MRMDLNNLAVLPAFKPGWSGTITGFTDHQIAKHLMSLGFTIGKTITVLSRSPFGNTYRVELEHRSVALRKSELEAVNFHID